MSTPLRQVTADPDILADVAVGNDKIFTVPAGHFYELRFASVNLVTTATAGNRQLVVQVRDASDNVVYTDSASATVAASANTTFYAHPAGDPVLYQVMLPAGADVRFYDSANVDVLDTFTVRMLITNGSEVEA